ncbi:MAG TPA: hypothetical protein PKX00_13040 [Opitutaceae bacterium]|nr:hypothetical protein [Opitutaceae bacterium]
MTPAARIEWFRSFLAALDRAEALIGAVPSGRDLRVQIGREIALLEVSR